MNRNTNINDIQRQNYDILTISVLDIINTSGFILSFNLLLLWFNACEFRQTKQNCHIEQVWSLEES